MTVHRYVVSSLVGFQFLFCDECFITISQVIKWWCEKQSQNQIPAGGMKSVTVIPHWYGCLKIFIVLCNFSARAIAFTPKGMTFHYDDQKTSDQSWKFHFKFSTVSGLKYPEIHRIQEHQILRIIKSWGQTILKSWGLRILNPRLQDIQSWDYIILGFRILKS